MDELAPDMTGLVEMTMEQQRSIIVRLVERIELRQGQPPSIYWR
jgi:hypothetical protein